MIICPFHKVEMQHYNTDIEEKTSDNEVRSTFMDGGLYPRARVYNVTREKFTITYRCPHGCKFEHKANEVHVSDNFLIVKA